METTIGLNAETAGVILSKKGFVVIIIKESENVDKEDLDYGSEYMILTKNRRGIVINQEEYHK